MGQWGHTWGVWHEAMVFYGGGGDFVPRQGGCGKFSGIEEQEMRHGGCKAQRGLQDRAGSPWIWRGKFGGQIETPTFPHQIPPPLCTGSQAIAGSLVH